MVFFLNLIFSVAYCIFLDREYANYHKKVSSFFILILLWTIIAGSQFDVGTDYHTYLNIFENEDVQVRYRDNSREYLFFYIVNFLSSLGFS